MWFLPNRTLVLPPFNGYADFSSSFLTCDWDPLFERLGGAHRSYCLLTYKAHKFFVKTKLLSLQKVPYPRYAFLCYSCSFKPNDGKAPSGEGKQPTNVDSRKASSKRNLFTLSTSSQRTQ